MSTEILMNMTFDETRIALLEAGILQELYIEPKQTQAILGNIYKGRVSRIVRGMQAAFVDLNFERSAFLHLTDLIEYVNLPLDDRKKKWDIHDFLTEGQNVLVQVYKDQIGTKGARLTTQLSLASRYLVLMPDVPKIQISQKITNPDERERLKNALTLQSNEGVIFRTAAEGVSSERLMADHASLLSSWQSVRERAKVAKPGEMVYTDLPIELRLLRDLKPHTTVKIIVDDFETVKCLQQFADQHMPWVSNQIEYYQDKKPIFDLYTIDQHVQAMLARKVPLKSGGYLVIDQTEAMVTIDVNTGSYLGLTDLGETAYQTNLEAVQMIATQMRLRNLGGIIIVDFIDMNEAAHRDQLMQALMIAVAKDTVRVDVSELTSLGLVQMTRKRIRKSIEHTLCEPCPTCQQRGVVKSIQTLLSEIMREIKRLDGSSSATGYQVYAESSVVNQILSSHHAFLSEMEALLKGKSIQLHIDPSYGREQYSVHPL